MRKKLLTTLVTLTMIVTSLFQGVTVFATTQNVQKDYEIYPVPHQVNYNNGEYIIRPDVNAIVEDKIDSATRNRLDEILKSKNKNVTKISSKQEGKTNIYLGIYDSNSTVDQYVKSNYNIDKDLFKKEGAYFLASNNDEIVVLGKNSDAVFYGLTSLKHIFNQMDGSTIRNFEIKDYADTKIRGFIEGYYGIPWSNEDRMELMKFGGDFKMTSYIFAPKDDPYHKEKWREEYPADELAKLKKMVEVGNASKCRFVWTAHPFMGGFDRNNADAEIDRLIAKFEHLYNDAGIRQFGVLGDDVGGLPRSIVIKMMTKVSEWAKSKGDVYDTVFCPGGYNHAWQGDYSELNEYDEGFPKDVQIFWTGEAVCQPIEQKTLEHFRNQNSNHHGKRRAPLFWLNWPVNDINHSRMIMGHATKMLQTDINTEDLAGAVTNPMQESEPSKVAIFQLADYSWNVKGYTGKKSWEDSFKYIEPNASDELHTLAKHMSNPEPNGHGLVMPESEELAPKLAAFKEELKQAKIDVSKANELIDEFEVIIAACDDLHTKSKNDELKKDLKPFTDSLKDLCNANIQYIKARLALDNGNKLEAFNLYTAGQNDYKASTSYVKPMLGGGTENVDPGSTELIPFAKHMEKQLSPVMNEFISGGEGETKLQITASSSYTAWYQGNIDCIIDGNEKNHAWYGGMPKAKDYFQVNFNIPQTVYGVHILNGKHDKQDDTFQSGKVMYQLKDESWHQLGTEVYNNHPKRVDISGVEVKDVIAVRYECVEGGNNWPAMREFKVALQPENGTQFTKEVIRTKEHWAVYSGNENSIVDGNGSTGVEFKVRNDIQGDDRDCTLKGDYIGVKLSQAITLGVIDILQGQSENTSNGNYFKKVKLQYSMDGQHWQDIEGLSVFDNKPHIHVDLSSKNIKAQYVRLENQEKQHNWIGMREFDVKEKQFFNSKAYTNVDELKTLGANVHNESSSLAPKDDVTLNKNQYVGIKLDRIHEITSIAKELENADGITLEVGMNEYEFIPYTEGKNVNARYIRLINKTDAPVTFNLKKLTTASREFYPKSYLAADSNFAIYEADSKPASNLFDGDWTTQVIFQASQHKGNKFVYDLGQEIDLNKLEVVCRDSEHDYPRHAKIFVSTDKQSWTPVMELGKQDADYEGEATDQDNIMNVLPDHKTSYNTKTVDNIGKKARYIKFEITRNKAGNDKWVRFQEFIINDGAYVPSVNNPTFESNVKDTFGGQYGYLVDQNLSSAYIPAEKNGKLTYHISDNNKVNTIKLVQAINPISNAVVKARIQGQEGLITLGTLSQTVNEFVLPDNTVLFDVVIEWNNVTPMLKEMVLLNTKYGETNKTELDKLLTEKVDTSSWTTGSKKSYEAAIEAGKKVKVSEKISQTSIDSVVTAIQNAKENAEIKGDMTLLENALQNSVKDKENYTAKSWRLYENAVNAIKAAKENAENTSNKDVEKLLANLENAKNKLVFNPSNMEESVLAIQAENDFITSVEKSDLIYTENSWKAYKDAKNAIHVLIEQNKETAVHPTEFKKALDSMKASKDALVNVSELKALIKEFEATDKSMYSKETFSKYEKAVNDSKSLLVNGTNENVAKAISEINNAKKGLQLNTSLEALNKLIKEIESLDASNYTKESFNTLNSVLNEVKNKDLANLTEKELKAEISKLNDAKNQLVSVEALKESLKVAQGLDKNLYTSSSYKNLEKLIADSQKLFNNGTKAEISKQISVIDHAVKGLVLRANENDVKEYLESIQLVDGSLYTKESYNAYMSAYNSLNKLASNLDDLSAETYLNAKENFEAAKANLVKLTDKQPSDSNNGSSEKPSTGSSTNTALLWSVLLGAGAVLLLTLKRRNVETE